MNPIRPLNVLLLSLLMLPPVSADDHEQGFDWLFLFDGKTLNGWEGESKWFRIEGGAIVAGNLQEKIPHNQFLCTTRTYADFELRLEVKLIGEGKNAGVQFRSKRVPNTHEVSGYQADAGRAWNRSVWGALYDESRRRKMLVEADRELAEKLTKAEQWNELRVVARGKQIQIYLNGQRTVNYTEEDESIDGEGVIGLQIHSGPPSEAWYRNIRLRQL